MELKQRKYINNLPKFDDGQTGFYINPIQWQGGSYDYNYNPQLSEQQIGSMITSPAQNPIPTTSNVGQTINGVTDYGGGGSMRGSTSWGNGEKATSGVTPGQKVASVIGGVTDLAGGVIGQLNSVKSEHEMMAHAGTVQGNIGGIGYEKQNYIDEGAEKSALDGSGLSNTIGGVAKGASAGAAFGPWGAAIGGVIGGLTGIFSWGASKRKLQKRLENARQLTRRTNTGAQAGAMTTALQQDYYKNNGNLGGVLYT